MPVDSRYALLAAAMAHVEGYYSIKSLAFRNRNPGNLEYHGAMRVFPTPLAGWEALIADIAANRGRTLRTFIAKYAPPIENDTGTYIQVVSTLSGIGPDEEL